MDQGGLDAPGTRRTDGRSARRRRLTRLFPSPLAEARARRGVPSGRRERRPVFVDDSGRRRRVARVVGTASGALALAYVLVVGVTFAAIPGFGRLEAPGLGPLTNPAGDQADVGDEPVERPVPVQVAEAADEPPVDDGEDTATAGSPMDDPASLMPTAPTSTTTALPTATTVHGRSSATPSSTVPDNGGSGGGPPADHPHPK